MRRQFLVSIFTLISCLGMSIGGPEAAHFNTYAFSTLDIPGARIIDPTGINNRGQIVGRYDDSTGAEHGFFFGAGAITIINVPGASSTIATGINNRAEIVGFFSNSTGGGSFLYSKGSFAILKAPGSLTTVAFGINDHSQIVGSLGSVSFFYSRGKFTSFAVPGARVTTARAINNSGEIVGDFANPGSDISQAFTYDDGKFRTIDVPGHSNSGAFGVNNEGEIVGFTDNGAMSFAYKGGYFSLFFIPNATITIASAVNDGGVIVGEYSNGVEPALGFIAMPRARERGRVGRQAPRAHQPLAPIEDRSVGTLPPSEVGEIQLDLVTARATPDDQPQLGLRSTTERHWRAGGLLSSVRKLRVPPGSAGHVRLGVHRRGHGVAVTGPRAGDVEGWRSDRKQHGTRSAPPLCRPKTFTSAESRGSIWTTPSPARSKSPAVLGESYGGRRASLGEEGRASQQRGGS